jgi:hypothetical protein
MIIVFAPFDLRLAQSNIQCAARRREDDEGEEFSGPLVTAATTYAQIGQGLSLSLGYAAPFGSFGVHL